MAFENDPEGRKLAEMYGGKDFDKPREIVHYPFDQSFGEWTLNEFRAEIETAISRIPAEFREGARVDLGWERDDGTPQLRISYIGPEDQSDVLGRIKSCERYVREHRERVNADLERHLRKGWK